LRILASEMHSRLPPHRMSEQSKLLKLMRLAIPQKVFSHEIIGKRGAPKTSPVISLINEVDPKTHISPIFGMGFPVVTHP
jgi:hypothetical protein